MKKEEKHDKIVIENNSIEVLIYKAVIDPYISHDEIVLVNNVLKNIMIWKKK